MVKTHKITGVSGLIVIILAVVAWYLHHTNIPVLEPRGVIAMQEKHLLIISTLLMLLIVVPVFIITFFIVWKYRETNQKEAKYTPEWDHSRVAETIWWLIPTALIVGLSILGWHSTHTLDPFRPIDSKTPAVTIQAVALDWKWLFIYPEQHIATVNYVEFPVNTPVNFQITSDAPMNSFWIPQLAGQIYAMPGMETQLHIMATQGGAYRGSSANISGVGFAGMHFEAIAASKAAYPVWLSSTKELALNNMNWNTYQKLARPSQNNYAVGYGKVDDGLFGKIINQYMAPATQSGQENGGMPSMAGMDMQ